MLMTMLTTVDNPFDPFDQYEEWLAFDVKRGHNSTGLLARIAVVGEELSESDQALAIEQAIDEICNENVSGMHRKVTKEFPDSVLSDYG